MCAMQTVNIDSNDFGEIRSRGLNGTSLGYKMAFC